MTDIKYRIIGPDENATFSASDREVASLVCSVLGAGYGAVSEDNDEEKNIPGSLYGQREDWHIKTFGKLLKDSLLERKIDLVVALNSFVPGGFYERYAFENELVKIEDNLQKAEYAENWMIYTSSSNDLIHHAHMIAKTISVV